MQRNPNMNPDGTSGQQYFDPSQHQSYSTGEAQGMSHNPHGGGFMGQNPGAASMMMMSNLSGGGAPSLTFTPSGLTGPTAPQYKNVKRTIKTLTENYENAVGASFSADAAFIQNYLITYEKELRAADNLAGPSSDRDEKPILEPEVRPDAEVFALIQLKAALDGFRQTANQAALTSRYLPQSAASHLDPDFELPQDLNNPTLNETQATASEQIKWMARLRGSLANCVTAMARNVDTPSDEDVADFLRQLEQQNYQF